MERTFEIRKDRQTNKFLILEFSEKGFERVYVSNSSELAEKLMSYMKNHNEPATLEMNVLLKKPCAN